MTAEVAPAPAERRADAIARRVRGVMAEQQVRQRRVAEYLGLSQAAFSRRATGELPFGVDEIEQLATLLNVTEAFLYGFTDSRSLHRPVAGGGSLFVAADEAGGTPSRTRTANPLIKNLDAEADRTAAVLPFRRRAVVAACPAGGSPAPVVALHPRRTA